MGGLRIELPGYSASVPCQSQRGAGWRPSGGSPPPRQCTSMTRRCPRGPRATAGPRPGLGVDSDCSGASLSITVTVDPDSLMLLPLAIWNTGLYTSADPWLGAGSESGSVAAGCAPLCFDNSSELFSLVGNASARPARGLRTQARVCAPLQCTCARIYLSLWGSGVAAPCCSSNHACPNMDAYVLTFACGRAGPSRCTRCST